MNNIIIRTHPINGIVSKIIRIYDETSSLDELCLKYGKEEVLRDVFCENQLSCEELFAKFQEFSTGKRNTEFEIMYKINSEFGVVIDEHIYLCRYNEKLFSQHQNSFPWMYVEGKKYIGDSWWFEVNEIIADVQNLSLLCFLEKYKGY